MSKKGLILWCQYPDCGAGTPGNIGPLPTVCQACDRVAKWGTTPPFKLTKNDETFLHDRGIDPETKT